MRHYSKVQMLSDVVPCDDSAPRLITIRAQVPRVILAQLQTHGLVVYNAESSRAVPLESMRKRVEADPFRPMQFLSAQPGMVPGDVLPDEAQSKAKSIWSEALQASASFHRRFSELGVAKEQANRLLEPWSYVKIIFTSTIYGWANFLHLRTAHDADATMQTFARAVAVLIHRSKPKPLALGDWSTPMAQEEVPPFEFCDPLIGFGEDRREDFLYSLFMNPGMFEKISRRLVVSAARCARVSYGKFKGKTGSHQEDADTFKKLISGVPHASPMQHQCIPLSWVRPGMVDRMKTQLEGWTFMRRLIPNETAREFHFHVPTMMDWREELPPGVFEWPEE